ncbi:MAG TPA: cytochrome c [Anaeromyxobacteraceae bacterium]|nr:cytochrome c [Anaeromyxobacteraceae bacterium]
MAAAFARPRAARRWARAALLAGALAFAACRREADPVPRQVEAWLAGAEVDGAPRGPRPKPDLRQRTLGAEVYRVRCSQCHGVGGDGRGRHAIRLEEPPRDFTTGVYELRSTPSGSLPTDEDLFRTVSRGLRGTAMIPWAFLPEEERWAVVLHLKSLSARFAEEPPGEPVKVPPAPEETADLRARGALAWRRAGCPDCHGPEGKGDGPSVPTLKRDGGLPIAPRPFAGGRFLRGGSLADLYLTLATGLDGTPMPSYASLPPEDLWAIAAHVRTLAAAPGPSGPDPEERLGVAIDILQR